ncbi:MAG: pitrilysin family protein [Nanoarchaeota archaeon]|nr:pitrilysin family protein [Nanoarchaeota archaeon]
MESKRYNEFEFDNGLSVTLQKTTARTISGNLRVNFGGIHEQKGEEGLAHFLEHAIMSAGTKKWSPEKHSEKRAELGLTNAKTALDETNFDMKILEDDFKKGLEFLSESVFNPQFSREIIEVQKEIILREISGHKSSPNFQDVQKFRKALYRNHPINYNTLGNEDVIKNAKSEDLINLYTKGYGSSNIDMIFTGNIPENAEELVRQYFEKYSRGISTRVKFPKLLPLTERTIINSHAEDLLNKSNFEKSSAGIYLGFVVPSNESPESETTGIINGILGSNGNSRLYRKLRAEKGLTYHISSNYEGECNSGAIFIETKIFPKRIESTIKSIFEQLKRLREEKVDDQEIERLRRSIKFNLASALDNNPIGVIKLERDKGVSCDELCKRYDLVTPKDVRDIAQRYFPSGPDDENYVLAIRNPLLNQSK